MNIFNNNTKKASALVAIISIVAWFSWSHGKNAGREEESRISHLRENVKVYETEWFALYHLSILDYEHALIHQKQKVDRAYDVIVNGDYAHVDPFFKWYYVDNTINNHPNKMDEILLLLKWKEERRDVNNSTKEAEQDASSNH